MNIAGQLLLFFAISLQLLQGSSGHSSIRQFETVALCPNSSVLPGRAEKSELRCASECSSKADCDLLHFNGTAGLCYHGNSVCDPALWSEGPCVSYKAVRQPADPIADQLSLKLLYRFGTHGLVNVANPSKHRLWSGNATVLNASGAHFVKSVNSFLMAETPCFENVVNKGNKFSIFVRAQHPFNIDAVYAVFRQCNGNKVSNDFYTYNGNPWHQIYWPVDGEPYLFTSGKVFDNSSSVAMVSNGVSHNMNHNFTFFVNGSMHAAVQDPSPDPDDLSNANFQCLLLGGFPGNVAYSMQGSISCFGLSTRVLTQPEFVLLDSWCQQV